MSNVATHPNAPKLLDEVRARIRRLNYSIRTEDIYVDWVRRFVLFHDERHPRDMGASEIEAFLTHLAYTDERSAQCLIFHPYAACGVTSFSNRCASSTSAHKRS